MTLNARAKGQNGEREFSKWLQKTLELPETPQRNLDQVRDGGFDVRLGSFIFEVKRCQTISLKAWWLQVVSSRTGHSDIPIVAYRPNHQPWRFLISATYIRLDKGFIQLEEKVFTAWLQKHYIRKVLSE
jgi:hypothetical protein